MEKEKSLVEYQQGLIRTNLGLIRSVLTREFKNKFNQNNIDDAFQEGVVGLVFAARGYDPECGKFSTYAYACIEDKIARFLKSEERRIKPLSLDELQDRDAQNMDSSLVDDRFVEEENSRLLDEQLEKTINTFPQVKQEILKNYVLSQNPKKLPELGIELCKFPSTLAIEKRHAMEELKGILVKQGVIEYRNAYIEGKAKTAQPKKNPTTIAEFKTKFKDFSPIRVLQNIFATR